MSDLLSASERVRVSRLAAPLFANIGLCRFPVIFHFLAYFARSATESDGT
jgi:hypothetical protein